MLYSPNYVLWSEGRITTKKHAVATAHHRGLVHDRAVPVVEFDANVALYPREGIVLTDRQHNIIAWNYFLTGDSTAIDATLVIDFVFHQLKLHADQLAIFDDKLYRRVIDENFDVLFFRILKFPLRCLEETAWLSRHNLDVFSTNSK